MTTLEFDGADDIIPEGIWVGIIDDASWSDKPSKNGEDMLKLQVTTLYPQDSDLDPEGLYSGGNGEKLFTQFVLPTEEYKEREPKKWRTRMRFLKRDWEAILDVTIDGAFTVEPAMFEGVPVKMVVEHENSEQYGLQARIKSFLPMDPDEKLNAKQQGQSFSI